MPPKLWKSRTSLYHVDLLCRPAVTQKLRSYGLHRMTLVSSLLIPSRNSKGNVGSEDDKWEEKYIQLFSAEPVSRRISETVQDMTKVTLLWRTNRKSHKMRLYYGLSIGTKLPTSSTLDDLEQPIRTLLHQIEPTAKIWIKMDPYYQRQKCRPMTLVFGNTSR